MSIIELVKDLSENTTRDLDDVVVEVLRKAIIKGHFKSEEKIAPTEIAEILQVSRMPVREAVQKLEAYGIVTVTGGRGSVVRGISAKEFSQLCLVRKLLESKASFLAAENISETGLKKVEEILLNHEQAYKEGLKTEIPLLNYDFHCAIGEYSGNPFLKDIIEVLMILSTIFWNSRVTLPLLNRNNLSEHREILQSLVSRNAEETSKKMEKHIAQSEEAIVNSMVK